MGKKFKYQADPQDKGNFKFLIVAVFLALAGLFLLFTTKQNLAASNPNIGFIDQKYGWIFLGIGLFLIFARVLSPTSLRNLLAKLEITGTELIIKNPLKPLNKISILDIDSVALRYEVGSIINSPPPMGPFGGLMKTRRYYVRQWGYLVKVKNGEIYEIKQNIENFADFLQFLQKINSSIRQNFELEEQSKQQTEEEFKKTPSFASAQKIIWDKDL